MGFSKFFKRRSTARTGTLAPTQTEGEKPFDLFEGLNAADMARLLCKFVNQRVAAGQTFIREGDPGDGLYIIRKGEVEVRRGGKLLARLGVNHVVGEMAVLDRHSRNADAVAATDCVLDRLAATDFDELCEQLPQLKLLLTRLVAHRLNWLGGDVLSRKIGHYHVIEQIGEGGMGWVFRAVRHSTTPGKRDEEVALKMLPHPLVQQPNFLYRFREEARLLKQLRHENIVALRETIELYGTMFLALEYVEGRNASEWVYVNGTPSADDVRRLTRAVTQALLAAHARGVVHRDVKPANVMIRTDGVVKLMDFGIAAPVGKVVVDTAVTLTPTYAAPEMFTREGGGPAGDFYSLGISIYELMTGNWPFEGKTLKDWARLHQTVTPLPLSKRCKNPPPDLEAFVQAALLKDPQARLKAIQPWLEEWERDKSPTLISRPPTLTEEISEKRASTIVARPAK